MSTKDDNYSFIEQSFTASEKEYYNLNLNQSKNCLILIPIQSHSKSNNDNYGGSTFTTLQEDNDDLKKRWKNENISNTINKSTLSLHISVNENTTEAAASHLFGDDEIDGLKKEKFGSIKNSKQCFADSLKSRNPFEFPRQQEEDRAADPEVVGFRSSQRILNPNQGSSSSYQSEPATKEHIRHYMKIVFDKNPNVTGEEMEKEIASTYPLDAPSLSTCLRWIKQFKSGEQNVELKDHERSGRPGKFVDTELHDFVLANPNMTVKMFAEHFECATGTISNHLSKLGIVHKFGRWIPHRLTPANIARRLEVSTDLLNRYNQGELNLDNILTTDEKWVVYDNGVRRRQWVERGSSALPTPRPEIHQKKLMLCFFWDTEGPVHFEFVPEGRTVDKYFYRQMLDRVQQAIVEKRGAERQVFFLQDNAPAHRAIITKEKIEELGWTLLPHPPYSPCLSPSDFHAFLSLSNWLNGKVFENDDQLKQSIQEWIDDKPSGFWVHGFTKLPQRWQKCIDAQGNYFEDD
uniref:Mos1 transposase HTH domain-containing protein n=1 Tax=Panagrolaimus davidi TaxID=227884 RepID=A0A914PJ24_9BILA